MRAVAAVALVALLCCASVAHAGVVRPHKHTPRMQVAQQMQQAAKGSDRKEDVDAAQVPLIPLVPDCVPKYVSDLILPPPMPLAVRPLSEPDQKPVVASADEAKASAQAAEQADSWEESYDDEPAEPANLQSAEVEAPKRKKLKVLHAKGPDASVGGERQAATDALATEPHKHTSASQQKPSKKQAPAGQDNYHVSVRQIAQQVLPPVLPNPLPNCPASFAPTEVYAYGPADTAGQPFHNWPGFTIEATRNRPVHVKWTNDLKSPDGNFLPHILRDSIDQTIHWANPGALGGSIDSSPCHACIPAGNCATDLACQTAITKTYTGPVPTVAHVHGQNHVPDYSDGYTEAWFLPNAFGIEGFYRSIGTWYQTFEQGYTAATGLTWSAGSATFVYPNSQRPQNLWYHDHTLGLTRTNVYAGLAGFYFVREKFPSAANGPELPGLPFPANDGVVDPTAIRELPLAIQDRAFLENSQLWYPVSGLPSPPSLPDGPVPPRWIPEFSATTNLPTDPPGVPPTNMLMFAVNGRTYPRHTVYPDAYRLRLLNGCNSRTMQLRFARSTLAQIDPLATADTAELLPFYVVGNDGGWYPQLQAPVTTLEMGPAERYDVVIDFSGVLPGEFVFMLNNGPETDTAIYDGTNNGVGLTVHTAQIMRFDVQTLPVGQVAQPFDLAQQTALNNALIAQWLVNVPPIPSVPPPGTIVRRVSLMEDLAADGSPAAVLLGVADTATTAVPRLWTDPVSFNGALNTIQYVDIINLSADSHPMHFHDVDFRYLGRTATTVLTVNPWTYEETTKPVPNPDLDVQLIMPCPTLLDPSGFCSVPKDTLIVLPGATTRIAFYGPPSSGLYVWHCHLVEHEDNEMMNPMCFGQPGYINPATGRSMCPGPN